MSPNVNFRLRRIPGKWHRHSCLCASPSLTHLKVETKVAVASLAGPSRNQFTATRDLPPARRVRHNMASGNFEMQTPAGLFRLLNEFIMLLLGALLILLAASHRIGLPSRPALWYALGAVLIFWGLRTGMRPASKAANEHAAIRGGSLILVGLIMLGVPLVSLRYEALLLALAGGVLVLRGLLGSVLLVRAS
jgi:hypothetical protein